MIGSFGMKNEHSIRDLLLYQKELLLHENTKSTNYVPIKFMKLPDEERRGLIRGLRWVLEADLEDLS